MEPVENSKLWTTTFRTFKSRLQFSITSRTDSVSQDCGEP